MGLEGSKKSSFRKNKAKGKAIASLEAHFEVAADSRGSRVFFFSARPLKEGEVLLQEEGEVLQQLERLVLEIDGTMEVGRSEQREVHSTKSDHRLLGGVALVHLVDLAGGQDASHEKVVARL